MVRKIISLILLVTVGHANSAGGFKPWSPYPGNSMYVEVPRCKKLDYEIIHRAMSTEQTTLPLVVESAADSCKPGTTFQANGLCQWYIDIICAQVEAERAQRAPTVSPFKR